jgi:hypothetical protein
MLFELNEVQKYKIIAYKTKRLGLLPTKNPPQYHWGGF